MNQIVNTMRNTNIEQQYEKMLSLELDYELATLFDAMAKHDDIAISKCKSRLTEITEELEVLSEYA